MSDLICNKSESKALVLQELQITQFGKTHIFSLKSVKSIMHTPQYDDPAPNTSAKISDI